MSSKKYLVQFNVELPDGSQKGIERTSKSESWIHIASEHRNRIPNDRIAVTLPDCHFRNAARVKDAVLIDARTTDDIQLGCMETQAIPAEQYLAERSLRGCIVVIAESPHRDEYFPWCGVWAPGAPLVRAQPYIAPQLRRLLGENGPSVDGRQIVLCNPVQHQASLANLMTNRGIGLQRGIRDMIWRALYNEPPIRNDFIERIRSYEPAIILVATTSHLADRIAQTVQRELADLDARVSRLCPHPSIWRSHPPEIRPPIA